VRSTPERRSRSRSGCCAGHDRRAIGFVVHRCSGIRRDRFPKFLHSGKHFARDVARDVERDARATIESTWTGTFLRKKSCATPVSAAPRNTYPPYRKRRRSIRLDQKVARQTSTSKLALVTGASSGIGFELARIVAKEDYDLVIGADTPLDEARQTLAAFGVAVRPVACDLSTRQGVDDLLDAIGGRPVDLLFANAGHGLGGAFLDQDFRDIQHVIDTNVTGTLYLLRDIAARMREQGYGRILVTGSIAGFQPGSYQAVYNGTKAFIDSFALALREELENTGVVVTCLMPGVTDTEFFERAGMLDTKVGAGKKMDPAKVARIGFDALMDGEADVVAGLKNKLMVAASELAPKETIAKQHAKMAKPGSASAHRH
jgi:short-subunit dehydrogenase